MIRPEENRLIVTFGIRPVCPYHGRVHDHDNMYARVHNGKEHQGLVLFCYRELQGEVKWNDRVFLDVE